MARVLSIEIGSGLTRVLETDYKGKNPGIYNYFEFETPKDMEADGSVTGNDSFYALLRAGLRERKMKTDHVIFTVNSGRIAVREVMVPMVKEKKLKSLVMANMSEYFPVDLSQYELGIRIMDRIQNEDGKHYKVALTAMPNEIIHSYKQLASGMAFTLMGLDYVGNSVIQAVKREKQEGVHVYIKIDEDSSLVIIFEEGSVALQRTISYGMEDAIGVLQRSKAYGEQLSYVDAVNVLRRKTCIRRRLDLEPGEQEEEDTEIEIAQTRAAVTEALRPLVGNISRILDYYVSRNSGKEIQGISLLGLGADFSGLSKLMSNELDMKVVCLQKFQQTEISRSLEEERFKAAEYAAGIGAVIAPLFGEEIRSGQELKKAGVSNSSESMALAVGVFAVCGALALGMAGWSVFSGLSLKRKAVGLTKNIGELKYAQETYDTYQNTKTVYDDVMEMYRMTETKNTYLTLFFKELEEKIPTGCFVRSLTADGELISVEFEIAKKEEAAQIIVDMRNFSSLKSVETSEVKEEKGENGETKLSFTAKAVYAELPEEEEKDGNQ